jgi:hypothetical protein
MGRVKNVYRKVYDVPRRPFEKERLDQVNLNDLRNLKKRTKLIGDQIDWRVRPPKQT